MCCVAVHMVCTWCAHGVHMVCTWGASAILLLSYCYLTAILLFSSETPCIPSTSPTPPTKPTPSLTLTLRQVPVIFSDAKHPDHRGHAYLARALQELIHSWRASLSHRHPAQPSSALTTTALTTALPSLPVSSGRPASRQQAAGSRQQAAGFRRPAGSRQQAAGSGQQAAGRPGSKPSAGRLTAGRPSPDLSIRAARSRAYMHPHPPTPSQVLHHSHGRSYHMSSYHRRRVPLPDPISLPDLLAQHEVCEV